MSDIIQGDLKRIVIGGTGYLGMAITAPIVEPKSLPPGIMLRWRLDGLRFVLETRQVLEDGCHWEWVEVPCVVGDIPEK